MKKVWGTIMTMCCLCISGCTEESVYSLSQETVIIPVYDQEFDPLEYLRKDGEPLSDAEKDNVKLGKKVDTSKLGITEFLFPDYQLKLQVEIVDAEAPDMSILGFEVEKDVVFTWTTETYALLKPHLKDNYDNAELLKKSLRCDSVDTSKVGEQRITCYIEDSSGNTASQDVVIKVVDKK
ncbi:MAG: DUF5011 domain-containing protein [Erysipelotrichaceae bacterium]|nr:DUF5011 domain-containing protein [Erysipelotrichaceae bacterium]MCI9524519.1 DUF5011 domain-containing protein [Erysipelotrichaceae bacterium]